MGTVSKRKGTRLVLLLIVYKCAHILFLVIILVRQRFSRRVSLRCCESRRNRKKWSIW